MLLPFLRPNCLESGIDEAGRGSLGGPVVAGCVAWDPDTPPHPLLRDSKKMTPKNRAIVREWILDNHLCGVGIATSQEIDATNILKATHLAMHRAILEMGVEPEHLLVDGIGFTPYAGDDGYIPHTCVIQADGKYASVAAASVLAKEHHDDLIREACEADPTLETRYGLLGNKGYGSAGHMEGLRRYGPSALHRLSFAPCRARPVA